MKGINVDSLMMVKVMTPGGTIVAMPDGDIPGQVRGEARKGDVIKAAQIMARLTGCRCTVEVRTMATAEPENEK